MSKHIMVYKDRQIGLWLVHAHDDGTQEFESAEQAWRLASILDPPDRPGNYRRFTDIKVIGIEDD